MGWSVGKYSSQVQFRPKVQGPKFLEKGNVVGSLQCQAGAQDLSGRDKKSATEAWGQHSPPITEIPSQPQATYSLWGVPGHEVM